jgi:hypothetical protein
MMWDSSNSPSANADGVVIVTVAEPVSGADRLDVTASTPAEASPSESDAFGEPQAGPAATDPPTATAALLRMIATFSASGVAASPALAVVTSSSEDPSSARETLPLAAWFATLGSGVCDRVEVVVPNPELGQAVAALPLEPVASTSLGVRSPSDCLGPSDDGPAA